MKNVTVLLSAYNGEKYIEEQLNSLFAQEGVKVDIVVRDDGSSDGTHEILDRLQSEGKLRWYTGENLRSAKSFMDLAYNAPDSEYYAFCDQDDFWLPDKLAVALEKLEKFPQDKPALYYGRPRLVNARLEMIEQSDTALNRMLTFESAVINSNATGCTMVFNKALLDKVRQAKPDYILMHDAWFHKVCIISGGNLYFDDDVHILYRQHENNVIGIDTSTRSRIKKHSRSAKEKECSRSRILISLLECYGDEMSEDQRKICGLFKVYKTSFGAKMKLFFNPKIRTAYFRRNVLFRMALLLNAF